MIETRMAWLAALQILAVLLGHAAGMAGESWCKKVHDGFPAPAVTSFYAHSGLWLLLIPLAWFGGFMVNQRVARRPIPVLVWLIAGIALLCGLALYGVAAMLVAFV